jgi:hypothetical protein
MWLRFNKAGFPADQAVALMPKADLLVIGLRVMVVPALGAGIVLAGLASIRVGRQRRFARLAAQRAELAKSTAGDPDSEEARARAAKLAEMDVELERLRDRPRPLRALPAWARTPAKLLLLAIIVALVMTVPFSPAAFAWPVVLVGLVIYWLRVRRAAPIGGDVRFPLVRIAIAGVLGVAVIAVARQTDPPARLPSAQVFVTDVPGLAGVLGLEEASPETPIQLNGSLITSAGDTVSIGDPTTGKIITVPRSRVTSLVIGSPLDVRAPPRSLLSTIFGGDTGWAFTPLEGWCVHLRYSWSDIGHFCKGRPRVEKRRLRLDRRGSVRGIAIACPVASPELTCIGFASVQFPPVRGPRGGSFVMRETPAISYQIARGGRDAIPLTLEPQAAEQLCGRWPLTVRVLLTLDATREATLRETRLTLTRPARRRGRCMVRATRGDGGGDGDQGEGGGQGGGGGGGQGGAGGGGGQGGAGGGGGQGGGGGGGQDGTGAGQGGQSDGVEDEDGQGSDQTDEGDGGEAAAPTPTPVSSGPTPAPSGTAQPIPTATPSP